MTQPHGWDRQMREVSLTEDIFRQMQMTADALRFAQIYRATFYQYLKYVHGAEEGWSLNEKVTNADLRGALNMFGAMSSWEGRLGESNRPHRPFHDPSLEE